MLTGGMTVIEQNTMESIQNINQKLPELKLRDIFAMHALNGMLASPDYSGTPEQLADYAYQYADAMIERRKK
jgi:hypothetical protein